jgi:hypothetical protein
MKIRQPAGRLLLPIVADLGAGEREVLALGTESLDSLVILDGHARSPAQGEGGRLSPSYSSRSRAPPASAVPNRPPDTPSGIEAGKAKLKGFGASELMTLVRDLYHASPENRQFLRGRLLHSPADLERYRRQVTDAVFPDPFSSKPVRVGEAERLIRHYRLSTGDESGTVDLMLAMVEAGTEQAVDLGYANEAYFASLERVLESVVRALPSVAESARPTIVERLTGGQESRVDGLGVRRRRPRDDDGGDIARGRTQAVAPRSPLVTGVSPRQPSSGRLRSTRRLRAGAMAAQGRGLESPAAGGLGSRWRRSRLGR